MKGHDLSRDDRDAGDTAFGAWLGEQIRGGNGDEPAPREIIWTAVAPRVTEALGRAKQQRGRTSPVRRFAPLLAAAAVVILLLARYQPSTTPGLPASPDHTGEFGHRIRTLEQQILDLERLLPAASAAPATHVRISMDALSEAIRATQDQAMARGDTAFAARHLVRLLIMKRRILEEAIARRSGGAT